MTATNDIPETSVPPVAPESSASRFRRFWARDRILWIAVALDALFLPNFFLIFPLATAQLDLFDASLGYQIAILVAFFFFFGPIFATILGGLFILCRYRGRFRRVVALLVFAAASAFFLYLPIFAIWDGIAIRRTARLYADFERAVLDGNADAATKFAQEMEARKNYSLLYPGVSSTNARGIALELNGELDASLDVYKTCAFRSVSRPARVYYRLGRRADAFAAYCRLADEALKFNDDRAVALEAAKRRVLFFEGGDKRSPLEPFADYSEFLRFIEEEFAKTADPTPFENAVQFWRDAAEIDVSAPAPSLDGSTHFGLTRTPFRFQSDMDFLTHFCGTAKRAPKQ